MKPKHFPPALAHGPLEEVFPDIFVAAGTIGMPGLPAKFSRNMTVLRHGRELTIVNSMRLDEAGLAKLEALGEVRRVVRLAGFHGRDDGFYKDRYQATVACVRGQIYATGFDNSKAGAKTYFTADVELDEGAEPAPGARLFVFDGAVPEGLLHLDRDGGILVVGDALQNMGGPDGYFNLLGATMMRLFGFLKPHNVGPGWLRAAKPSRESLARLLELEFEHVIPAHGAVTRTGAKQKFRPALEAVLAKKR